MEIVKNQVVDSKLNQDDLDNWFETFIDDLKTDHMLLSQGVAGEEKRNLYTALMQKDAIKLAENSRKFSTMIFVKSLVEDYIKELKNQDKLPLKLALGLSDSKILVWSEIEDNNEEMEDALIMAEARVNGKYYNHGFYVNSTIIEKSDNLDIPPHYQQIL